MILELTHEEIDQVHGGWGPLAVGIGSGIVGGIAYWRSSSNPSAIGLTAAVLYSGLGGTISAAGKLGSFIFGSGMMLTGNELASRADDRHRVNR
ncbi:class IIb bacteriocin, lactobin A/cerein 7B family [Mitsuaria sp. TWR114]|jgi:lactobin A/cerein 7B family class IIb bacteriocin|uniref:class IIb bacteriocin, lactobin A/cerein 7B family n=1 Tax=Mitsuaria sp. TWR114 TaxID=2601731 RepID=UPI0011BE50D5|nr:class IIb bacteriocin, lactobin A/cerein 7B family [Mitsuaria sp. TWR114]TXD80491.1 class IIb bacteriocin, lactobin A/cerein 7B family [Mitsuaria sp. TWR114]